MKKVISIADFRVWMDVVNTALHGWDMLTIEHYSVWLECEELGFMKYYEQVIFNFQKSDQKA